ncbi:sulfotransferase [Planctomycetota bacterium]|nr:sulfotransferase [Planctomycetota bacterium]
MKPTVVILLSDKRSGSTQFERELSRHRDVQHASYCAHSYNETHHWLKSAVVLDMPSRHFADGHRYKGYGGKKGARALLVDQLRGNLPDFHLPEEDRQLVFKGWEAMCRQFAHPVFFEKSPQHLAHWSALSLMLEWAEETDLDVKFIGLVRNPAAVLHSAWELFGTPPQTRQAGWVSIHRNLLAFQSMVPDEDYLGVTYEDMVGHPRECFDRVLDFIGLERDPAVGADVHGKSLEKWRTNESFSFLPSLTTIQMAQRFGYDRDMITPDTISIQSPQRRNISRVLQSFRNRVWTPLRLRWRHR